MNGAAGLLRAAIALAFAAAMSSVAAEAPGGAEETESNEKKDGIDYTKPFLYDGVYPLNPIYRPCSRAIQNLRGREDHEQALKCVRRLLSEKRSPEERANLLRLAAQLEVELGDFEQAIKDIEAAIATGALTQAEKAEAYYFLGRLYLGIDPPDYDKSVGNLRKHLGTDDPNPDAYFYLGQALALQGKYREAIPNAKKAIELSEKPKESHYRLLLYCYSELRDYPKAVSTVERMLKLFPIRDEYLSQLAAAYQELGRDRDAFLVQAFRYELGILDTESELVGMADLYLLYENPHRAAQILEKEMNAGRVRRTQKNLEKLANMYFLAREYDKARKYLTEATSVREAGQVEGLFHDCSGPEDWDCIEKKLREALKSRTLKTPCQARVLLGHTLLSDDRPQEAIEEFRRAARSKTCSREASQWVRYLTTQMQVDKNAKTYGVMRAVINEMNKAVFAVGDDETVLSVAEEALEAVKAALETESDAQRQRKLAEYDRARDSALHQLNEGYLEEARKDRAEAEKLLAKAADMDLTAEEKKLLQHLDKTSKRRVEALEKAQVLLKQAEQIAKRARAKLTPLPPSAAGH